MLQVSVCEGKWEESRAELSISQRHCLGNKARLSSSVWAKQAVLLAGVTGLKAQEFGLCSRRCHICLRATLAGAVRPS